MNLKVNVGGVGEGQETIDTGTTQGKHRQRGRTERGGQHRGSIQHGRTEETRGEGRPRERR